MAAYSLPYRNDMWADGIRLQAIKYMPIALDVELFYSSH